MELYKNESRYVAIDILKAFCAFLIVCIHCPFSGIIGEYIVMLARIAVPIFFMITGFFYSDVVKNGRTQEQIRKLLILFFKANMLYLLWKIVIILVSEGDIYPFLRQTLTIKVAIKFFVFNDSPFGGHLWYLGAILYVLIIIEILNKLSFKNALFRFIPILLIGDLLLGKYSLLFFDREFPYIVVRNFLFVGLPYFCIGMIIRKREDEFRAHHDDKSVKRWCLLVFCIIVLFVNIIEKYVLMRIGANATRDHYISTTLLAIIVFMLSIQSINAKNNRSMIVLAYIGNKCSTWIYYFTQ